MHRSVSTVNADKARQLFSATGRDIVWAVLGTGIDAEHPHFSRHKNLVLPEPLSHRDFTGVEPESPLTDGNGYGTHLAGIIAGEMTSNDGQIIAEVRRYDPAGEHIKEQVKLNSIAGMAPECKLLSMKVMDETGEGMVSSTIAALAAIQEMNGHGRRLYVHGVLVGFTSEYEPEAFACGLSPICVEVERLIRSGVVVVVPTGNQGYGVTQTVHAGAREKGIEASITDPGNAELAITVGSTHREMPRLYGVSYFSGKGPTLDGRLKPDLVAPGEKIVSCSSSAGKKSKAKKAVAHYKEDDCTGISAAHVAGVIAGFLSVHREYIGRPELVKQIFLATASDLQRIPFYQGKGLVDAMRALQYDGSSAVQFDSSTAPHDRSVPLQDDRGSRATDISPVRTAPRVSVQPDQVKRPLKLMCSYSHKDEALWDELKAHLASLSRQELIVIWHDRRILAGDEWKEEIGNSLEEADIILLLVSAYFVASDYCYDIEMKRAIERHNSGEARVIPVIARPSDWSGTPFGKLQALPLDAKAATEWKDQHAAWENVAQGLRKVVEKIKDK